METATHRPPKRTVLLSVLRRKASAEDLEARHHALATRFVEARQLLTRSSKAAAEAAAEAKSLGRAAGFQPTPHSR